MPHSVTAFLVLKNVLPDEWSYRVDEHRRVIGRSPAADIRLPEHFGRVSRRHAEVWTDRQGIWIRAFPGAAATRVNGVWVGHLDQPSIMVGDTLWIAGAELVVISDIPRWLEDTFGIEVLDETPPPQRTLARERDWAEQLTAAEVEVLLCLTRGHTTDEQIGDDLVRSPATVQTEFRNLFQKLGVRSRIELLALVSGRHRILEKIGGGRGR